MGFCGWGGSIQVDVERGVIQGGRVVFEEEFGFWDIQLVWRGGVLREGIGQGGEK